MIVEFAAVIGLAGFGGWLYLRPLKRSYGEAVDRAKLFSLRGEVLFAEKRVILENIDEGVITCDREERITFLNRRAQALLGLKSSSILSKKITEVAASTDNQALREVGVLVNQARAERGRVRTFVNHLEMVVVLSEDDHGLSIILKDHSNQQKMIEMGKDFIANASHELRTPITIIRGFAETLLDLKEISEEMFDSIMGKIIRNCERMEVLVKNLLTLADLDSTGVQMKECELISIIDEACYTLVNVSPETDIEQLHNADQVDIWGDPSLLELAIFNLLKNAVKYSEAPAKITITVDAGEDSVQIKVQDRGMGIAESELTKIFDRFYTVDKSHSRKMGGAGLGLAIVKTVIEQHQGKIWATSQLGLGTTFHILLPRL